MRNLQLVLEFCAASLLTLLAGRVGQVVNLSGLSGETGVSGTTLAEWLSILESSMTFNPDFIKPIRVFCEREKEARAPALIYDGETLPDVHGVRCVNYCTAHALLDPLHIRQKE